MRLTPATALSEQDIADRLNVSRQPVREAFIKLSRDRHGARAAAARHLRGEDLRQGRDRCALRARGGRMRDRAARQRRPRQAGDRRAARDHRGSAQGGARRRRRSILRARRGVPSRPRERGRMRLRLEGDRGSQGADGPRAFPQHSRRDAGRSPDRAASGDPRRHRGRARRRRRAGDEGSPARDPEIAAASRARVSRDVRGRGGATARAGPPKKAAR